MRFNSKLVFLVSITVLGAALTAAAAGKQEKSASGPGEKITFYYVMQDRKASAPGDEEVREFINKKFNVDYKRIDIPQDQIAEKMAVMIATGEQIDFFSSPTFGTTPNSLPVLVAHGTVQPVDEFLAKYGKNLMKEIPDFAWKYVTYNGRKMSVPDMGFKSKRILFVRRDWMDNLGIKNPQNYDDFEQMLRKMKTTDPDGTGLKQRYPLAAESAQGYFDLCFLSAFVPTGNSWYLDKDGKFVPWFFHPAFKDYMATFSRWYKDQLIHPDIMILKREELKSVVVQGMVGVFPEWYSLSSQDEVMAANPKAKMDYFWWPKGPSGTSGSMSETAFNTQMVVHAKATKTVVERFFQIMDWMQTPEGTDFQWYGIEGKHWVKKDGVISTAPGIDPARPAYKGQLYINAGAAWKYFSESSLIRPPLMSITRQASLRGDYPTIDAQDYMYPLDWNNTKSVDLMGDLNKMYGQMYAEVLTGKQPVSYIDDFIKEWRKKGGDTWIEEYTVQFKKLNALYK
jgi:putative aldouronate transport system substrate-binding protein